MSEYIKSYQDKAVLEQFLSEGLDSREIGKKFNVSHKLINQWLLEYGLIARTSELALP